MNLRKILIGVTALAVWTLVSACGNGVRTGADGHAGGHGAEHAPAAAPEHGADHGGEQGDGGGHRGDAHEHAHEGGHGDGGGGEASTGLRAGLTFPAGAPKAGEAAAFDIRIEDAGGAPVEAFDVSHEKLMHLIVVSEDLAFFAHLHPEYEGGGVFRGEAAFPAGGRYKLFADFVPTGGAAATIGEWVDVEGEPKPKPLRPERTLVKQADGTEIELTIDGLAAGADATLTFAFRDAVGGAPVDDLQPYLGAIGHVVVVSADAERYLHVHPVDDAGSGPEATFHTSFPARGVYKIWGQFQRDGKLMTVPFTIEVP